MSPTIEAVAGCERVASWDDTHVVRSGHLPAISLWNPWAMLMVLGAKRIETRCWDTNYRGEIAIAATKNCPAWMNAVGCDSDFADAIRSAFGVAFPLHRLNQHAGCVVAVGRLVDVIQVLSERPRCRGVTRVGGTQSIPPAFPERAFGDYRPGRFAWLIDDIRPLATPVPAKGGQRVWHLKGEPMAATLAQVVPPIAEATQWVERDTTLTNSFEQD